MGVAMFMAVLFTTGNIRSNPSAHGCLNEKQNIECKHTE